MWHAVKLAIVAAGIVFFGKFAASMFAPEIPVRAQQISLLMVAGAVFVLL